MEAANKDASGAARLPALLAALAAAAAVLLGSLWPLLLCGLPLLLLDAWPAAARLAARLLAAKPRPAVVRRHFDVCEAAPSDAGTLSELYWEDYVTCHRRLHRGAASAADWEAALGPVDFENVIREAAGGRSSVRLLKCVDLKDQGPRSLVGYVLYELREKGPPHKRQRYCELVNIVVRSQHRGCGAGRLLFEALREDLVRTAPARAGDLRLFVDKSNAGPLEWYRRLGFQEAGKQSECVGGTQVNFLRMAKRQG
mmetsp:Transcript_100176/g.311572  ORF Transcript_100176/g.311572 Transcript_100176/m.311572 type:complete len:255 (-) Transcript_100176:201-965(-)